MANSTPIQTPPVSFGHNRRGAPVVKPKNMKGTLRRLWSLTKGRKKGLGWIILFSSFASLSGMISPYLIGKIVDQITIHESMYLLLFLLTIVYASNAGILFLQRFLMASVGQKLIYYIRTDLFHQLKQLPISFYDKNQHGDVMSRLTNDIDNISTTISDSITQVIMLLFTLTGILGIMLYLNVVLTLVTLATIPLMLWLVKLVTSKTRKLYKEQQLILGKLGGHIEESISGLTLVKAFGQESSMIQEFEDYNEQLQRIATKAQIYSGFLMPFMNVINNLGFIFVSITSGLMASYGLISIGTIASFLLYTKQFSRPINELSNIYNTFQTAVAGAERVFELLDEEPEPADCYDAKKLSSPKGDFVFDHVSFSYQKDCPIIQDLTFHISPGTKVAIVGSTGAGKTTIINLLTRFYDVTSGSIQLDGYDLRDYSLASLRACFGVVLQDTSLFQLSILDNIRYGHIEASKNEVITAATIAGANHFIERLPNGYETVLEEGGSNLSQGERQLLTIARAVLANAPILILDEATSSVDTRTEQKIRQAMLTLTAGKTSFIIAHRLSTIRDSDLILLLEHGQIAEMGTHNELMEQDGLYAAMYKTQTGIV